VTTLINHSKIQMPRKWIQSVDSFLRLELKLKERELTIVFLDVTAARKINKAYRKKDYATDILSFEGETPNELGELVICPQVLQKQAKEHDLSFKAELSYMLIHGVLHLLGYDHEKSKKEAKKMFDIQDQLFDRLRNQFDI
jgi:probable rRNA maturation factor